MTRPALSPDVRRARRAALIVGGLIPAVLTAIAVAVLLAWLPEMPTTVATHWSASGVADGFAPAWTTPLFAGLLGGGLAAMFAAMTWFGSRDGSWGPGQRFLAALGLATSVFILTLITWTFGAQRGSAGADAAVPIFPAVLVGLGLGLVAGAIGWFVQPRLTVTAPGADATPAPVAVAPGLRAAWLRTTSMSRGAMWIIAAALGLLAIVTVVTAARARRRGG